MKTRKIILLAACGILLAVCIVQGVMNSKGSSKKFELTERADELILTYPDETFSIIAESDATEAEPDKIKWLVGDKRYVANYNAVEAMVDAISNINVMDKVASANNEAVKIQYGLSSDKVLKVEAKKAGNVIRTVYIGKDSTALSQCYITLDGKNDVYLAGGNVGGELRKTVFELRTRGAYVVDRDTIKAVTITNADGESFTVTRTIADGYSDWSIDIPDVTLDTYKVENWFTDLALVSTPEWHDDADLTGEKVVTAVIDTSDKKITVEVYESETDDPERPLYFAFCSETPFQFELADYTVQKFLKSYDDLI